MNTLLGFICFALRQVGYETTWHRGCKSVQVTARNGQKWELLVTPL